MACCSHFQSIRKRLMGPTDNYSWCLFHLVEQIVVLFYFFVVIFVMILLFLQNLNTFRSTPSVSFAATDEPQTDIS